MVERHARGSCRPARAAPCRRRCWPARRRAAGRWRARRRTAPWPGRSPAARRRRPPRSRRSSGGRGSPRRTCWSAPSRPRRAPPAGRSSPRRSSPACPAGGAARARAPRRSRDRPRPGVRSGSFRVAQLTVRRRYQRPGTGRVSAACARRRSLARLPPSHRRGGAAEQPLRRPGVGDLLCPDLRVGPPTDLYVEHARWLRHAAGAGAAARGNDIRSRPRADRAARAQHKQAWMQANQAIYRVGGGVEPSAPSAASLLRRRRRVGRRPTGRSTTRPSMEIWSLDERRRPLGGSARARRSTTACATSSGPGRCGARPHRATAPAARTRAASGCRSAPRSAGRTSTPPTTTASGSASPGCAAATPSSCGSTRRTCSTSRNEHDNRSVRIVRLPYRDGPQHC